MGYRYGGRGRGGWFDKYSFLSLSLFIQLGVSLGTSGLGGIIAGILADRVGKRDILAVTILTYSVGSLITALAPTFGVFLFGKWWMQRGGGRQG